MWRFHNPPSVIYQGINTHTQTDSKQKKSSKSPPFSVSQCFFFLFQSQGRVYGGEWCVNVGYQTRIKGWITLVWCVSSATSLECYSCSAESSNNCVVKQQCSGGGDSCLQLSSNGTALIKHSDVDDVQTPSWLAMPRQKTGEKKVKIAGLRERNVQCSRTPPPLTHVFWSEIHWEEMQTPHRKSPVCEPLHHLTAPVSKTLW